MEDDERVRALLSTVAATVDAEQATTRAARRAPGATAVVVCAIAGFFVVGGFIAVSTAVVETCDHDRCATASLPTAIAYGAVFGLIGLVLGACVGFGWTIVVRSIRVVRSRPMRPFLDAP